MEDEYLNQLDFKKLRKDYIRPGFDRDEDPILLIPVKIYDNAIEELYDYREKFPLILLCAFRYALGRRSYIVSKISEEMIKHKEEMMIYSQNICEDIENAIKDNNAGDAYDVETWKNVLNIFKKEK